MDSSEEFVEFGVSLSMRAKYQSLSYGLGLYHIISFYKQSSSILNFICFFFEEKFLVHAINLINVFGSFVFSAFLFYFFL